ncbi:MAG: dihydrofolate reductase [Actinophytocola sp.]|uniref:dihydrofolate reductase family protein n=1 Tax=Actinophytocola sp. TaxID=1872138 RepID=UPI00132870D5|nr:dihydrofolate reductase family protein [Actinophytocola sp.]MPZ83441.1 dihydrofolate reductase [Actinophytocola sp.]
MGKIVNATYMTLDGDVQNVQDWHFAYFGDEARRAATGQLYMSQALIMGRETYEGFEQAWSTRTGADEFADRMNSIKKYVVSTTLKDPTWTNTTVVGGSGDTVAELRALKEQEGDILQYGYGQVTRLLVENGLLDELRIWLHPVLSGKAKPTDLLYRDSDQVSFTLNGVETQSTGLIVLSYTPVTKTDS